MRRVRRRPIRPPRSATRSAAVSWRRRADGSKAGSAAGSSGARAGVAFCAGLPPSQPNAAGATGRKSSKRATTATSRFGLTHERRWRLSAAGERLEGQDLFHCDPGAPAEAEAVIRFHLAPGIKPSRQADRADDRPGDAQPESLAFRGERRRGSSSRTASSSRPPTGRRTQQIVLRVRRRNAEPRLALRAGRDDRRGQRGGAEPLRSRREILERQPRGDAADPLVILVQALSAAEISRPIRRGRRSDPRFRRVRFRGIAPPSADWRG